VPFIEVSPVVSRQVRKLCVLPYEGHPKGCPNFNHADRCPPKVPYLNQIYDLSGPFWAIYSVFPLGEHVAKMRVKHPDWSPRQLACVLYWQGTARKNLRFQIEAFRRSHDLIHWLVTTTPEAMGCDVTATLRAVGINLEWPAVNEVKHVALAGTSHCHHVAMCFAQNLPIRAVCRVVWPSDRAKWCSGCRD
jgi:hypothetical protein